MPAAPPQFEAGIVEKDDPFPGSMHGHPQCVAGQARRPEGGAGIGAELPPQPLPRQGQRRRGGSVPRVRAIQRWAPSQKRRKSGVMGALNYK